MHEITELLQAWNKGDEQAFERLMPLVDPELKKIAHNYMRKERPGHILQTTALVNEALLKLIRENLSWENRKQFYAFMAKRMRQVLIDDAKKQSAAKRGKRAEQFDVAKFEDPSSEKSNQVLMLDEALTKLARIEERKATIVECLFFIGLSLDETAEVLGTSPTTVQRDWRFARAWLKREMTGEPIK